MFNFITKFFDYNQREIDKIKVKVVEINSLEDRVRKLKDSDFRLETVKLKEQVQSGEKKLDDILPWSYALVREASRRILGQRHFDVQLIAGIALHQGKIAEQKTGEGKTLSATTALYLNALTGKGTHLVTVNDYLARRDAGWMGIIFNFLGLTTSAIISDKSYIFDEDYKETEVQDWRLAHLKSCSRREAYLADVTYGINSEFGFDYLRDNMASSAEERVQRNYHFAIIDEADSVLIDEARTPHIISAPYEQDTSKYFDYAKVVKQLDSKNDFVIDEKSRTANLTEKGVLHVESLIGVNNIYEKDYDTLFHVEAALKAETLFQNNKDYIVKDGEVIIVDEFTGRLLHGRRFSEGIHQAIEAKENVSIQRESKTLATVSLQNYFRMYEKLAGMTGTAATESEEFHKIYKADVLIIPTHMPMVRKDHADMIYKTEKAKFNAVAEEIAIQYKIGRPVLIGTTSIQKNEHLSQLLNKKGIPHELLNAKNHLQEASIIAQAGKKGAITVATNMAGRGVDIILGGADDKGSKEKWQKEHDEVVKLGGLYIIGTERHESRRIDNQLRGRSGRQGDPGETRFFVSLQDDLMRIFGGDKIARLMTAFKFPEDQALTHPMVSKAIEQAQVKVEGFNFDIRKHLVDYDDVLNRQREIIYSLRKKVLISKDEKIFSQSIFDLLNEEVNQLVSRHFFDETAYDDKEAVNRFVNEVNYIVRVDSHKIEAITKKRKTEDLINFLNNEIQSEFKLRQEKLGIETWQGIVRYVFLSTIDNFWTEHLTSIEDLREGINLRGYAQLDPLVEYKNEAFGMFEKLVSDINFEVARRLFKVEVDMKAPASQIKDKPIVLKSASAIDPFSPSAHSVRSGQVSSQGSSHTEIERKDSVGQTPATIDGFKIIAPGTTQKKLGRNDPCHCGSGKKYKRCHYPN